MLASLDQAGAGQADPGGDPPHAYIPAGLVEVAPYLGYCPPEVRQEAFAAVLDGVETGRLRHPDGEWLTGGTTRRAGRSRRCCGAAALRGGRRTGDERTPRLACRRPPGEGDRQVLRHAWSTLRQLFYRLVSAQVIPHTQCTYKRLSELTAQARRQSTFPALIDRGRQVHEDLAFTSPEQALGWLARITA